MSRKNETFIEQEERNCEKVKFTLLEEFDCVWLELYSALKGYAQ